ncbi:MAG: alkaline phosphatase [Prevotellaceae bacterium]|jgi:alkaline phosphatase|nr:alkaline phosphatase [Prevotellaceae bacterium]
MKQKLFLAVALIGCIVFSACTSSAPHPKYVFLFIGDGMGLAHVTLTEDYIAAKNGVHGSGSVSFTQFPITGLVTTYSANTLVTCSSAAATALSTGHKTNNNMMGIAPDSITHFASLTYPLHRAGYKIGVATSVSIDHATPGAFYATSLSRSNYYEIATQAASTGFDFFAGSGFIYPKGKNKDQADIYEQLETAGYRIVRGPEGAAQLAGDAGKIVLVQAESEKEHRRLPYAIDRKEGDLTLPQITQAAIKTLYNPDGFFALIEGGQIDWAAHANDGAAVIHETIDFSEAVKIAMDFYRQHPDETLILVTADHETGGLSLGRDGKYAVHPLAFDGQQRSLESEPTDEKAVFVQEINSNAFCAWPTKGHTGTMVPVYAIGAGSERFSGKLDNTDIPKRIAELMGVEFSGLK